MDEGRGAAEAGDTALRHLPDGVLLADGAGRVTAVNRIAERILETSVEPGAHLSQAVCLQDLSGNDWFACADPYDGLAVRSELVESSWWSVSGREVLVTVGLQRERPAGRVVEVAVCLRRARARERGDRSRSELVATVAHELRSPLTGVKGFTSTLISKWDRLTDPQKLLMLSTVDADADRLTRLIGELLDVARIDVGRLSVRKEPTRLAHLVASLVDRSVAPAGRRADVRVVGDPTLWVDRDRLAQVLVNLVDNAYEHGRGEVTVCVRETPAGGAEIVVDDEGQGIPEDIRTRIFTKFWRRGGGGGTGLGLFIVAGLVSAHDGTVVVERSPAGGARMRVGAAGRGAVSRRNRLATARAAFLHLRLPPAAAALRPTGRHRWRPDVCPEPRLRPGGGQPAPSAGGRQGARRGVGGDPPRRRPGGAQGRPAGARRGPVAAEPRQP